MRIWRHATQTSAQRILVYSPATDVYNIGMSIIQERRLSTECIVQLNVPHSQVLKYLHINNLIQALQDNPDLATFPRDSNPDLATFSRDSTQIWLLFPETVCPALFR